MARARMLRPVSRSAATFDELIAVLDPDQQAFLRALPNAELHPTLVNGTAGVVITVRNQPSP